MKNILKIVFLGIVGFSILVYLTMPKNVNKINNKNVTITIETIPKYFDIVGNNPYTKVENLFKLGEEKYIIVLNHDALAVFKELYKYTDKNNIVLVANISNTPWIIKQIAVNGELEKMYKNSKIPLINDSDGNFISSLGLNDNKQNKYFVYKLTNNGIVMKIGESKVKEGALEKGLSLDEVEKSLNEMKKILE
ncbi:MAG: hypothetical protein AB7S49_10695 [Arcobacter sp.]|jgi:peroxiredoxin|uniref:hypothetical protein n=1 Tax=unclassified Arcobacter TaxID=2593671 RepID=UPI0002296576|nr:MULTISPECIES: hypothetical protein [unclassified Arcobacter]MDY3200471.1 hypothetical protein [Arcobacter sp.]BAK73230.1 conserved hypothetical protein [Arcobacter sp. L]